MQTRAWVMHIILTVIRIVMCLTAQTIYDIFETSEMKEEIDEKVLIGTKSLCYALTIVAVIIDLCCIKWRQIARLIYPLELIQISLIYVLPYDQKCYSHEDAILWYGFFLTIALVCDIRAGIVTQVLAALAQIIIRIMTIEGNEMGRYFVRFCFISTFMSMVVLIIAMLMNHVVTLQTRIRI